MAHDATKVVMGTTRSSSKQGSESFDSSPTTFKAGLAVRRNSSNLLSVTKADGNWVGVSLGRGLSDALKTTVIKAGEQVPVLVSRQPARGVVTITSYANLVSGTDDSITVGATVFTAQAGAATLGQTTFQAATSNTATATSLAAQINAHATAGALVKATSALGVVTLTAISNAAAADTIAMAYTDNDTNIGATKSGTVLSGGNSATLDYDDVRLAICTIVKDCVVAGVISQGDEVETITLPNNQSFDFKFALPVRTPIDLKLTVTLSGNNQFNILTDAEVTQILFDNINARYKLGLDFEPQRYFSVVDAPWASNILLEYDTGGGFVSTVFAADFDDLFTFAITDITVVNM